MVQGKNLSSSSAKSCGAQVSRLPPLRQKPYCLGIWIAMPALNPGAGLLADSHGFFLRDGQAQPQCVGAGPRSSGGPHKSAVLQPSHQGIPKNPEIEVTLPFTMKAREDEAAAAGGAPLQGPPGIVVSAPRPRRAGGSVAWRRPFSAVASVVPAPEASRFASITPVRLPIETTSRVTKIHARLRADLPSSTYSTTIGEPMMKVRAPASTGEKRIPLPPSASVKPSNMGGFRRSRRRAPRAGEGAQWWNQGLRSAGFATRIFPGRSFHPRERTPRDIRY